MITRNSMPASPPDIVVKIDNDKKIETAKGDYSWFDGKYGGNSYLTDSPDILLKNIEIAQVEKGQKIDFSFKTSWQQPNKNELYLIDFDTQNNTPLEEQSLNYNEFNAPEECGEYNFMIFSWWDETHSVTNVFKINVV